VRDNEMLSRCVFLKDHVTRASGASLAQQLRKAATPVLR
jgi:hypothetical protein